MEHELEQEVHPDYLKGFNDGYLLRQHNPELADSLARSLENIQSERAFGFIAGSKEYEKERTNALTIPWMKKLPENDNVPLPGKDLEKEDPGIDMEKD